MKFVLLIDQNLKVIRNENFLIFSRSGIEGLCSGCLIQVASKLGDLGSFLQVKLIRKNSILWSLTELIYFALS